MSTALLIAVGVATLAGTVVVLRHLRREFALERKRTARFRDVDALARSKSATHVSAEAPVSGDEHEALGIG